MKVFKFGGASLREAQSFHNLFSIVSTESGRLIIVVSAIGKTTNLLESILKAYLNQSQELNHLVRVLRKQHFDLAEALFPANHPVFTALSDLLARLEEDLRQPPGTQYDYEYDRLVSYGELLSSIIAVQFLSWKGLSVAWLDVRELIVSDEMHRDSTVRWTETEANRHKIDDLSAQMILTQGFIAASPSGATTTLGREGSDYSAAIIASLVQAESMTVWKDVAGIFTGDPARYPAADLIPELSYSEAMELSYYGAKVIHPKTIKPLQNKKIPLFVKSFLQASNPGTCIHSESRVEVIPPIVIHKENQVLLSIVPHDYSFIREKHLSTIFGIFADKRVTINVSENAALSFSVCVDNDSHRIPHLLQALKKDYSVRFNTDCELLTIRHYSDEADVLNKFIEGKKILLEQRNRTTVRWVLKQGEKA